MKERMHQIRFGTAGLDVYRDYETNSILIPTDGKADILSTAIINGGYREDLSLVFNHTCSAEECYMLAETYEAHMLALMRRNRFDPACAVGMTTAAQMTNCVVVEKQYQELTVTALVTAGIEKNGGRAGDPSSFYDPVDRNNLPEPGTINMILVIDADIAAGTAERALVMCTEAKTAALQELLAGSNFSTGIATGSGTDQTVILTNPSSHLYFEHAGKHSKLGELIGLCVKEAVKKALFLETGLDARKQFSVLRRPKRFGVTDESMRGVWENRCSTALDKESSSNLIEALDQIPDLVTYTSLFVHLLDQIQWGLLTNDCAMGAADTLFRAIGYQTKMRCWDTQEALNEWQYALLAAANSEKYGKR